ncbi:MAG: NAD(P)-dependent oxidoreductase, partial [Methylococcales bacterium]|nr:NAD(P)-dependent oxidoreductase [Methylococcales bacterium]
DLKICQGMAKAQGLSIDFLDQTLTDYQQLMTEGYGDEDISALYRLKRPD